VVARAVCEVDLDAISANVEVLRSHAPSAALLAVVKADAYGHGLLPSARAAIVAITTAPPVMSRFMVTIDSPGLIERPPESKVIPLPTRKRCPRDSPSGT